MSLNEGLGAALGWGAGPAALGSPGVCAPLGHYLHCMGWSSQRGPAV